VRCRWGGMFACARRAVLAGCAVQLLLAAGCTTDPPSAPRAELILRGGSVHDGSGRAAFDADVAISAGVIAAVGDLSDWSAEREIDARGLAVAPGFIDMHSHADLILLASRETQESSMGAKISQGVTTVIVGNCGLGAAPASAEAAPILASINGWMTPSGVALEPASVGEYLDTLQRQGVTLNVGTLVPHGPLRISARGMSAGEATPAEIERMRRRAREGLREGAFGLSAGLIYPPGMYSPTAELIALAHEVAAADALFSCHVRGSSRLLLPATEELIEIGRESGARVHHSHLEAVGREYWPVVSEVLAMEDRARAEGVAISHDVFPYTEAATMMAAVFPPSSLDGGIPQLLERLDERDSRRRIGHEIESRRPSWPPWVTDGWPHNLVAAVGWDGIRLASIGEGVSSDLTGRSVAELAQKQQRSPFDLVADLMVDHRGRVGQIVGEISGASDELEMLTSILRHPSAAIVSDAEDYGHGLPHPAHAGAFARALRWNREQGWESWPSWIRRMSGYPAELLGIKDRGLIRTGLRADLTLLDLERVSDRADWSTPRLRAEGISWVLINGEIAVGQGAYVGGLPGEVLRASPR